MCEHFMQSNTDVVPIFVLNLTDNSMTVGLKSSTSKLSF